MQIRLTLRADGRVNVVPAGSTTGIVADVKDTGIAPSERAELESWGAVVVTASYAIGRRVKLALASKVPPPRAARSKQRPKPTFYDIPPCMAGAQGRGKPQSGDTKLVFSVVDARLFPDPGPPVHPANKYLLRGKR